MLQPSMPFQVTQAAYQECYSGMEDIKPSWIPAVESSRTQHQEDDEEEGVWQLRRVMSGLLGPILVRSFGPRAWKL